jgi:hypothetical protein
MAAEVIKGDNLFTLVKQAKSWSPETGWAVVKTYEGPQALAEAYADTLIAAGALSLSVSTGVPCQITAPFPANYGSWNADQKAVDEAVWELVGETVEKRLETHGRFIVSGSSAKVLNLIDKAIEDGTAADTDWEAAPYAGLGAFNDYRDLRLMGTDSYESYIWRVRSTQTVSKESLLKAVFDKVGQVISWSAIKVPSRAKFEQPVIHMMKPLTGSVAGFTDEPVNEWLVQPPSVRWRKGIKKWEITQEWVGAVKISGTLYDGGLADP